MENIKTLYKSICEAIDEAIILEFGRSTFDTSNILKTASRLSKAPQSLVSQVFYKRKLNIG
jgi:hypothetical protein